MIVSLAIILTLAGAAVAVAAATRWLDRRIPTGALAGFVLLAMLPFPGVFVPSTTPLPLDHVSYTEPWHAPGGATPYNPYLNDIATQMLPWAKAVRMAWKDGALPLRDRWNGCGMALAANGQSAAFSPFTLLTLPLPLIGAFPAAGCVKLLLALSGMWLWLRELSASRLASLLAAIAFAFSMSFSQWIFFPHTAVFCLWPWMLFLLERCRDPRGRRRAAAALTVVLAAAALAGHPESLALGVLFCALWIAGRRVTGSLLDSGAVVRCGLAAGLAAAGLTAFLLLPTALAIRASNRMVLAAAPHWSSAFSLRPHGAFWRGLATAFFPRSLGDLIHAPQIAGVTGAFPEMALGYFGIVGWAAALLVARPGSPRDRASWVLLALVACGLGTSVALWPFAEIFGAIPVLRHVFPLRFASWAALAGPALAALELDRYARDRARGPGAAVGAAVLPLALGGVAVLWYLHLRPEYAAHGAVDFQRFQVEIAVGLLATAAVLPLVSRARTGVLMAGLTALCAGDLLSQWRGNYRPQPASLFYPRTPLIEFLRGQPAPFRVAGAGSALFPNTNVFAGVEDVRTHDPVERRDYVAFLDATAGYPPGDYFKRLGRLDPPVFDFLNVRFLVADPGQAPPAPRWRPVYSGSDGTVFENTGALPRAFAPEKVRLVARARAPEPLADANAAFGAAFRDVAANTDWHRTAWVLADRNGEEAGGHVEISNYLESTNAASLDARVGNGGAWIVLSLVQDGGWSARTEDGGDLPVSRANGPFLALRLPPGRHRVALSYIPPGFRLGTGLSLATLGLLAAASLGLRARRGPA